MPAWSGLYNGVHGVDYSLIGTQNGSRRLGRALAGSEARKINKIVRGFVTGDTGTVVSGSHSRIVAYTPLTGYLGGVRQVETATDINRALTAADKTALLVDIDHVHTPAPFPTEKSGNSGGGKLGF